MTPLSLTPDHQNSSLAQFDLQVPGQFDEECSPPMVYRQENAENFMLLLPVSASTCHRFGCKGQQTNCTTPASASPVISVNVPLIAKGATSRRDFKTKRSLARRLAQGSRTSRTRTTAAVAAWVARTRPCNPLGGSTAF
jgi:hypothetical protein